MEEIREGTVESLDGGFALIRLAPHGGCRDCGACGGTGMAILARNDLGALPGERVRLEPSTRGIMAVTLALFILPLAATLLGVGAGAGAASLLGIPSALPATVGAILFLALALRFAVSFDRRAKAASASAFRISSILRPELED